jgi:DNA-binding NarL/FixJ family response regulator
MYPVEQFAAVALKAGANGYVSKDAEPDELVAAIREVSAGRNYIPRGLAAKLFQDDSKCQGQPAHYQLSPRELQIMTAIVAGKSLTLIGNEMFLSVKTVSTYRTRIMEKLGLSSNAELVRYAVSYRLIG